MRAFKLAFGGTALIYLTIFLVRFPESLGPFSFLFPLSDFQENLFIGGAVLGIFGALLLIFRTLESRESQ